jgi:Membrane bound O-acyl transferase family
LIALLLAGISFVLRFLPRPMNMAFSFWSIFGVFRLIQGGLYAWPFRAQVLGLFMLIDVSPEARIPKPTPVHHVFFGLVSLSIAIVAFRTATDLAAIPRTYLGAAGFLCLGSGADWFYRALLSRFGLHYAAFDAQPLRSRTLEEFWGRRWNRLVAGFYKACVFIPLAPRIGAHAAALMAFLASAAYHFIPIASAAGFRAGAVMALFFLLHGGLVALERLFGVARLPVLAQRVWTWTCFLITLPLFVEPLLYAWSSTLGSRSWLAHQTLGLLEQPW